MSVKGIMNDGGNILILRHCYPVKSTFIWILNIKYSSNININWGMNRDKLYFQICTLTFHKQLEKKKLKQQRLKKRILHSPGLNGKLSIIWRPPTTRRDGLNCLNWVWKSSSDSKTGLDMSLWTMNLKIKDFSS